MLDLTEIKARVCGNETLEDLEFVVGQVPALIARVERLQEALAFYADALNYMSYDPESYSPLAVLDEGRRARLALGIETGDA